MRLGPETLLLWNVGTILFDSERIREFEERELTDRLEAGTAYNRSRLPPQVLLRALTHDEWFEAPKRKEGKRKGRKEMETGEERKGLVKQLRSPLRDREKVKKMNLAQKGASPIPS